MVTILKNAGDDWSIPTFTNHQVTWPAKHRRGYLKETGNKDAQGTLRGEQLRQKSKGWVRPGKKLKRNPQDREEWQPLVFVICAHVNNKD